MEYETRIHEIEHDMANLRERVASAETSAKGAWKTISETKNELGDLYDKVEEMEKSVKNINSKQTEMDKDMKQIKASQDNTAAQIKSLRKWLIIIGAVIVIAGFVMYRNGSEVPEKVVELMLPIMKQGL